ncbi:hypothetical protein EDB89DRAFT_903508 [Lactarius sanguifluus]|nr:hypothetical protein EDB89DRAFT_903508 [Lactarius sanguifluus]
MYPSLSALRTVFFFRLENSLAQSPRCPWACVDTPEGQLLCPHFRDLHTRSAVGVFLFWDYFFWVCCRGVDSLVGHETQPRGPPYSATVFRNGGPLHALLSTVGNNARLFSDGYLLSDRALHSLERWERRVKIERKVSGPRPPYVQYDIY